MAHRSDPVAAITGVGSGLGEQIARAFAAAGFRVACVDQDEDAANRVCCDLLAQGKESIVVPCDLTDIDLTQRAIGRVLAHFGRIDVLVNDASSARAPGNGAEAGVRAPFVASRAVVAVMRERAGGHIINVTPAGRGDSWTEAAASQASRWQLVDFGREIGQEGRSDGIRVTTVVPGGPRTYVFDQTPGGHVRLLEEPDLQSPLRLARFIAASLAQRVDPTADAGVPIRLSEVG